MKIEYTERAPGTSRAILTNDSGAIIVEPSNVVGFDLWVYPDSIHLTFEDAAQLSEEIARAAKGALHQPLPAENIVRIDGQAYRMVLEPVSEDAVTVPRTTR